MFREHSAMLESPGDSPRRPRLPRRRLLPGVEHDLALLRTFHRAGKDRGGGDEVRRGEMVLARPGIGEP